MKFEYKGFEKAKADLNRLDDTMLEYGFVREGQWDYERVTYDHKFEFNEYVYYLRIMGIAVNGDVGAQKALIQLKTPILGKHYYPHGVEYGDGENFPASLVAQCENILTELKIAIDQFTE